MAAVLRDITLLKHLDRMKNDFVNTVSHDLKNPISVIDGTAEVISWKATDPALLRRVQRIRDEARYMAELVTDLLDLGKIEAGLGPPKERVDVVRAGRRWRRGRSRRRRRPRASRWSRAFRPRPG